MYRAVIYTIFVGLVCLDSLVEYGVEARRNGRKRNRNPGAGDVLSASGGDVVKVRPTPRRPQIPLKAEVQPPHSRGVPGCTFGADFYNLEDEWHPNLGEPFGEMVCVVCECRPEVTDGILSGKISCRNIKCPDITCPNDEDPVIKDGFCCKTCPSEDIDKEKPIQTNGSSESHRTYPDDTASTEGTDDTLQGEAFVSILSGRLTSANTRAVSRGSFLLMNNNLHFTMHVSRLSTPLEVVFTGVLNTTLHVHTVRDVDSDTICGEWRNVPQIVSRDLRNRNIFVTLTTRSHEHGEVRGRLIPHRALSTESFSVLLTPKRRNGPINGSLGKGGLVMLSSSKNGNTLNFAALLDGLVESERTEDVNLVIEITRRNDVLKRIEVTVAVEAIDVVDVLESIPSTIKKAITKGQLKMRVTVQEQGDLGMLVGSITPLRTCNSIHAVLSGSQALERSKTTGASGSAVFTLDDDGTINYMVRLTGLQTEVSAITIEMPSKNRRKIVADIFGNYRDGLAQGKWLRPKLRDVQMFLHGELYVNVATGAFTTSELRGRIVQLPYQGHIRRHAKMPIQMSGSLMDPAQETGAAGHAWLLLDEECSLNYEIAVVGLNSLTEDDIGTDSPPTTPHFYAEIGEIESGESRVRLVLNAFRGNSARGTLTDVNPGLLESMDRGQAFIQISTKNHREGEIRGQIILPNTCHGASNGNNLVPVNDPMPAINVDDDPNSCFFEGRYHAPMSTWSPDYDRNCTTCTCKKTVTICDPVICPELSCDNPVTAPGECCPSCPKPEEPEEPGCHFKGDKKVHRVGTQWHPYIPPFGYTRCVLCTCMPGGNLNCSRLACPSLDCPKPIRLNANDCCQVCPEPEPTTPQPPMDDTLLQADEVEKGCSFLGEFYRNGAEWHPLVSPFGTMSCVRCRCRNGQAKCKGRTCPQLSCKESIRTKGECCPRCKEDMLTVPTTLPTILEISAEKKSRRKEKLS
ncbi:chordin-like isoform X1 [Strongylocentrotus purpuratus]|uniref:Chordin n=1 Tax=Strongylocentrotus purpuratus TaxID=7668 RepID=A0A7M7SZN8_STRPU|nr:chordin-like isoform X1 [Strongylocentrotus purpuratus]